MLFAPTILSFFFFPEKTPPRCVSLRVTGQGNSTNDFTADPEDRTASRGERSLDRDDRDATSTRYLRFDLAYVLISPLGNFQTMLVQPETVPSVPVFLVYAALGS